MLFVHGAGKVRMYLRGMSGELKLYSIRRRDGSVRQLGKMHTPFSPGSIRYIVAVALAR